MKPRILINMHYMEIGGAERALLGLLNAIDTNRVDVDLFINQHTGEFMSFIPKNINLIPEIKKYSTLERPIVDIVKEGYIDVACARIFAKIRHWLYCKINRIKKECDMSIFQYVAKYTTPLLPSLKKLGNYDLAISFLAPHNIVAKKVSARKKIAWIHTDYSTISINKRNELPIWKRFDNIISISSDVTATFGKCFPSLSSRIIEIENILSPSSIIAQSKQYFPAEINRNTLTLCSVGRFVHQKNFENIPYIAEILKQKGLKFKWYIIGFGEEKTIKENLTKTATKDCVIIVGKKENPYPYMANCDIYVQPSRYEGKAVTVREAQILQRPVVITNYPTAASQINNGTDGIICQMDNSSIANAIHELFFNSHKRQQITQYLADHEYGNECEAEKLYALV